MDRPLRPVTRPPEDMEKSYFPPSDLLMVIGNRLETSSNREAPVGDSRVGAGDMKCVLDQLLCAREWSGSGEVPKSSLSGGGIVWARVQGVVSRSIGLHKSGRKRTQRFSKSRKKLRKYSSMVWYFRMVEG